MQYLKAKQYYIDLYDKHTVETCRRFESNRTAPDVPRGKKVSKKEAEAISNWAHDLMLTFEKGEHWLNKSKTISEWMEHDRKRDEFLDSTNPPHLQDFIAPRLGIILAHVFELDDSKFRSRIQGVPFN